MITGLKRRPLLSGAVVATSIAIGLATIPAIAGGEFAHYKGTYIPSQSGQCNPESGPILCTTKDQLTGTKGELKFNSTYVPSTESGSISSTVGAKHVLGSGTMTLKSSAGNVSVKLGCVNTPLCEVGGTSTMMNFSVTAGTGKFKGASGSVTFTMVPSTKTYSDVWTFKS